MAVEVTEVELTRIRKVKNKLLYKIESTDYTFFYVENCEQPLMNPEKLTVSVSTST